MVCIFFVGRWHCNIWEIANILDVKYFCYTGASHRIVMRHFYELNGKGENRQKES